MKLLVENELVDSPAEHQRGVIVVKEIDGTVFLRGFEPLLTAAETPNWGDPSIDGNNANILKQMQERDLTHVSFNTLQLKSREYVDGHFTEMEPDIQIHLEKGGEFQKSEQEIELDKHNDAIWEALKENDLDKARKARNGMMELLEEVWPPERMS